MCPFTFSTIYIQHYLKKPEVGSKKILINCEDKSSQATFAKCILISITFKNTYAAVSHALQVGAHFYLG